MTFSKRPTGLSLLRHVPPDRSPEAPDPPRVQLSFRVCSKPQPPNKGWLSWGPVPYGTIPSGGPACYRGCLPDALHFQGLTTLLADCIPPDLPALLQTGAPMGFALQSLSLPGGGSLSRGSLPSWRFSSSLPSLLRMRRQRGRPPSGLRSAREFDAGLRRADQARQPAAALLGFCPSGALPPAAMAGPSPRLHLRASDRATHEFWRRTCALEPRYAAGSAIPSRERRLLWGSSPCASSGPSGGARARDHGFSSGSGWYRYSLIPPLEALSPPYRSGS